MKSITIFTPTYNRAYVLHKLYDSLCRQTSQDFEWLIVDDGSTDRTEALVKGWEEEGKIALRYYRQPNGGKMRAHNYGVRLTETELFVCVDSDDYLTDVSVEHILDFWRRHGQHDDTLSGMIGYKCFVKDERDTPVIKCRFPYLTRDTLHHFYRNGFYGDTTLVYRTCVIARHPFPEIDGEKFITEGYAYSEMDAAYRMLPCDEAFIVCQYMEDGYTQNAGALKLKYPKGWAMYYNQQCRLWAEEFSLKEKLSHLTSYIIMAQLAGSKTIYRDAADKSWRFALARLLAPYYKKRLIGK